jgi:hypothetical protein
MAIMVHFRDDTVSFVPDKDLGELILADSIVAFRRGSEWVTLAVATIQRRTAPARKSCRETRGAASRGDVWKRIVITDVR